MRSLHWHRSLTLNYQDSFRTSYQDNFYQVEKTDTHWVLYHLVHAPEGGKRAVELCRYNKKWRFVYVKKLVEPRIREHCNRTNT